MKTKKPIFYFEKFESFDKWSLGFFMVMSIALLAYLNFASSNTNKSTIIIGYCLVTHFCLYSLLYKSLRNMAVFIIWTAIGLLHLVLYFDLNSDLSSQLMNKVVTAPLKNTIVLLLLYQVLRIISLKIQDQELVSPHKNVIVESFDERDPNRYDKVLYFTYIGCLLALYKYQNIF